MEIWNKRAGYYDNLEWQKNESFIKSFINFCKIKKNDHILDAGCGSGTLLKVLPIDRTVGIDPSIKMIEISRKINPNVHLLDVENVDKLKKKFDLAIMRMVLHHVNNPVEGLSSIRNMLKDEGRICICEGIVPSFNITKFYERVFALKEPSRNIFHVSSLSRIVEEAGFMINDIRIYNMKSNSLSNWLTNSSLDADTIEEIRNIHVLASPRIKKVYKMETIDDDVIMDWKFIFIEGIKVE